MAPKKPTPLSPFGARRRSRQARAERTRTSILEAARTSFETSGFENTPVKVIAKHAGVSVGAVYEHFDNKRELLMAVGEMEVARIKEGSFKPFSDIVQRKMTGHAVRADDLVRTAIRGSFDSRRKYPKLLALLDEMSARDEKFSDIVRHYEQEATDYIENLILIFKGRHTRAEARIAARFLFRTCEGLVQHCALRPGLLPEDDIVDELTTTIMRYLFGTDPNLPNDTTTP